MGPPLRDGFEELEPMLGRTGGYLGGGSELKGLKEDSSERDQLSRNHRLVRGQVIKGGAS